MTEDLSRAKKKAQADGTQVEKELNLSSDDSLSAASLEDEDGHALSDDDNEDDAMTRATLEMPNLSERDPVPEGFKRTFEL